MYLGPKSELTFRGGRLEDVILAGLTPCGPISLRVVGWIGATQEHSLFRQYPL